jgi:medium-chain acyl-[acyl-carrier-protein] hydrolase
MVSPNEWICGPLPDPKARVRLFCFPYAGGGANAFSAWRSPLRASGIDVCCVQLPGRETRFRETPLKIMDQLALQVCDGIQPYLDVPFSFFGHSVGALVCFEVASELERRRLTLPRWLLISGALHPHRRTFEALHGLPTGEFIEAVAQRYNGLPPEVLANEELLDILVPILRADLELFERYRPEVLNALSVNIAVFGGQSDESVPANELQYWIELTTQPDSFHIMLFDGDHFFFNRQRPHVLAEVARILS